MPWRAFLTKEMADFLGVLAHPHRIRIVQELRNGELDVNTLQSILEVSHSRVSQHLSVLRSHRIVAERREGRHVFYRLQQHKLASWLADGLDFLKSEYEHQSDVEDALRQSRTLWKEDSASAPAAKPNGTAKANGKASGRTATNSGSEDYV